MKNSQKSTLRRIKLTEVLPENSWFFKANQGVGDFSGATIYDENAGVTRFVLCALAEQSMTKESWVDLWKYEGKLFVWTIEHIFPQGDNIPAPWVTMIAGGDEKKAKAIQETHVHKLGNLTISGFNSALGNKSFQEKRDRTDSKGREVGYKNGLKPRWPPQTAPLMAGQTAPGRTGWIMTIPG